MNHSGCRRATKSWGRNDMRDYLVQPLRGCRGLEEEKKCLPPDPWPTAFPWEQQRAKLGHHAFNREESKRPVGNHRTLRKRQGGEDTREGHMG